jgi:hypothetical protein
LLFNLFIVLRNIQHFTEYKHVHTIFSMRSIEYNYFSVTTRAAFAIGKERDKVREREREREKERERAREQESVRECERV